MQSGDRNEIANTVDSNNNILNSVSKMRLPSIIIDIGKVYSNWCSMEIATGIPKV
jgi:hypothetical protein